MNIVDSNCSYIKFKKSPLSFQCTFETPLKDLERFLSVVNSLFAETSSCKAYISSIVFEPKNTNILLGHSGISEGVKLGHTVIATSNEEAIVLLESLLSDWVDFLYIPSPKKYAVVADHDEYCTFFAPKRGAISKITAALKENGYKEVNDFIRLL